MAQRANRPIRVVLRLRALSRIPSEEEVRFIAKVLGDVFGGVVDECQVPTASAARRDHPSAVVVIPNRR